MAISEVTIITPCAITTVVATKLGPLACPSATAARL
ncbi:hypothetical protein ACVWZZ_005299 [Bradyrhizobium sp. LM6.10]